ncbi:urease accessory protein [Breoghania corrubedonensis]|uniref:Urease accessory protein UreD n=1 Tax=Breoghania corrubedonensis TaxID=665038 RepID=A0A2T5VID1_9HYPH|nr:urease accessory protein UreD [Breoghania corrubedonensis]PTW63521.1 urease accessory protein [Breoghania corrubedonensis]
MQNKTPNRSANPPMLAPSPPDDIACGALQRARGKAHVAFAAPSGGETARLVDLYQSGCAKIRLPKARGERQAVLLNTAGGIAGGDRLDYSATWGAGARAVVTSQAAERIYRSLGPAGEVANRLVVEDDAHAVWLPQETIVFNEARLERRLEADLSGSARLLAVEAVVLGRAAMGESVERLGFRDRWRVRRDGRLVFADDTRLCGDARAILSGPACGGGATAFATIVEVGEGVEARLDAARAILVARRADGLSCGASAWGGLLVVRLLSTDARVLRDVIMGFLQDWRGTDLPRVWHC